MDDGYEQGYNAGHDHGYQEGYSEAEAYYSKMIERIESQHRRELENVTLEKRED